MKCKNTGCCSNRSAKYVHSLFEDDTATLKYNLKTINDKIEKLEERFAFGEITETIYRKFVNKCELEKVEIEKEIKKVN